MGIPGYSAINKGMGDYPSPGPDTNLLDVLTRCNPTAPADQSLLKNWQDNLLYTGPVSGAPEENVVLDCTIEQRVIPGSFALTDYNFKTPETSLLAKADGKDPKYKLFEFPGNHLEKSAGDAVAPPARKKRRRTCGRRSV